TTPTPTAAAASSSSSATVSVNASGSPTPAPPAGPSLQTVRIKLTKLATFDEPVAMAVRKGDPVFYIVEKSGRVKAYRDGLVGGTALDLSSQVSTDTEQGLLGLAFSPDGTRMF